CLSVDADLGTLEELLDLPKYFSRRLSLAHSRQAARHASATQNRDTGAVRSQRGRSVGDDQIQVFVAHFYPRVGQSMIGLKSKTHEDRLVRISICCRMQMARKIGDNIWIGQELNVQRAARILYLLCRNFLKSPVTDGRGSDNHIRLPTMRKRLAMHL